jgi:TRAP-type C4-dicarboxylate transport system permease small subunit
VLDAGLRLEARATRWSRRLALLGGWLLLLLSLVTCLDALLRKVLSSPISGTFEASELLLAAVIFLAMPYTGLTDGHVSVDALTGRLGARGQDWVVAVNALVCAVVLGAIAWQLGLVAAEHYRTARTTITARIPVFPFSAPVAAVAWLAALAFVVQALGAGARALRPAAAPAPAPPAPGPPPAA